MTNIQKWEREEKEEAKPIKHSNSNSPDHDDAKQQAIPHAQVNLEEEWSWPCMKPEWHHEPGTAEQRRQRRPIA